MKGTKMTRAKEGTRPFSTNCLVLVSILAAYNAVACNHRAEDCSALTVASGEAVDKSDVDVSTDTQAGDKAAALDLFVAKLVSAA